MIGRLPRVPRGALRTLLGAWLFVASGWWALSIALSVYAYDRSGPGAVGAIVAAHLLPAMFAAPLTGGSLDRWDRTRVVATTCAVQGACLGVTAALILAGASLVPIAALAAVSSAAATASRPGLQAMMPALSRTPAELIGATAVWSAIDNAGFLIGAGAGGAAIAALGPGTVVAAAAVVLTAAAGLAARLPQSTATELDEPEHEEAFASALAGLRALIGAPMLRAPFALLTVALLLEGASDVQLVALSLGKLHMGRGGPGELMAAWGVGGLLASATLLALVRRRGYGLALGLGSIMLAIGLGVTGLDGVPLALAAMLPAGIGFALVEAAFTALVPRLADDAVIGRVYALMEVCYGGAVAVGALVAPLLIDVVGVGASLAAVGGALGLATLLAWASYARLDAGQEEAGRVRELLRGVPFLAPLPLARLERLVRDARPVGVRAGTAVVQAGEHGDAFFVIEAGHVEIEEYGRELGPASGFGEIALLRDVARTATVRAVTDLRLWTLSRHAFLSAVDGKGEVGVLAEATVDEHLARPQREVTFEP